MVTRLQAVRAKQAWPLLVSRAATQKPYTYVELCEKLDVHPLAARFFLSAIESYCLKRKMPPLTALVVSSGDGLPGEGYRGSIRKKSAHDEALDRVSRYKWSKVAPNFLMPDDDL